MRVREFEKEGMRERECVCEGERGEGERDLFVDVKSSFQIKGRRPWIQFAKLRRRPNEEKNESNDAIFKSNRIIIDVASFEKMFKCPKLIQIFV